MFCLLNQVKRFKSCNISVDGGEWGAAFGRGVVQIGQKSIVEGKYVTKILQECEIFDKFAT